MWAGPIPSPMRRTRFIAPARAGGGASPASSERWTVAAGYRTIEGGADNEDVYTFAWLHSVVASVGFRF